MPKYPREPPDALYHPGYIHRRPKERKDKHGFNVDEGVL